MNSLVFAGGTIKSAFFNASIVRAMRHIERTATITDPAEAAAQASDEQKKKPFQQRSRSALQAEREKPFVAADNPILLAAAVSLAIIKIKSRPLKRLSYSVIYRHKAIKEARQVWILDAERRVLSPVRLSSKVSSLLARFAQDVGLLDAKN
jgi:hypothetical protein